MFSIKFQALVEAPRVLARVIAQDRDSCRIATGSGETKAELAGRFRHDHIEPMDFPVVGDYVEVAITGGTAIIHAILPRENLFARRGIDGSHQMQPIAANIDRLFLVMAVNGDFNLRRVERYLVAAATCGVPCALILNKIDLTEDGESYINEAHAVTKEIPVIAMSALNRQGISALAPYRGSNKTITFVGSSGVGKSTLINALLEKEVQSVKEIREGDDRGKHSTTRRCMFFLKDGTALIDTPGMREFALADAGQGIDFAFSEVQELSFECRFRNCKHTNEPGCAVKENMPTERLSSFYKLEKEAAFEARKSDRMLAAKEKQKWKQIHKEARNRIR